MWEPGKMAVQKGVSSSIKKLGAMMVKNHSKANQELKKMAAEKNITLPGTMSDQCQKKVSDLREKNGLEFDKAYGKFGGSCLRFTYLEE